MELEGWRADVSTGDDFEKAPGAWARRFWHGLCFKSRAKAPGDLDLPHKEGPGLVAKDPSTPPQEAGVPQQPFLEESHVFSASVAHFGGESRC